jgi:hypothetical protein
MQGQGCTKNPERKAFGIRRWAELEGINGIWNQGSRQQPHLRKENTTGNGIRRWSGRQEPSLGRRKTLNKTFRKTTELEIAKQTVGTSVRLWKMSITTLWPPPKRETVHRVRAGDVGELKL